MGVMKEFEGSSTLFGSNAPFIEELYERYLADPASVEANWRGISTSCAEIPTTSLTRRWSSRSASLRATARWPVPWWMQPPCTSRCWCCA
jgi:2-oxoglutarate dehydrogenase complex dehydrogenase (E1) component-like enzyme